MIHIEDSGEEIQTSLLVTTIQLNFSPKVLVNSLETSDISLHFELSSCANLRVCLCEGDWSASLSVHQSAQSSLALDDAVWDAHLAAQSWQEDDELEKAGEAQDKCLVIQF